MTPTNQADLNVTSLTDKGGPGAHSSSSLARQALRPSSRRTLELKARQGLGIGLRTVLRTWEAVTLSLVFIKL